MTLNDGMVHIVNDSIYAGERVEITDSLNGETTLLILQAPGVLGTTMDSSGALVLWGCCGGKAAVEIQGGDVNGSISGGADSCITIAGGTVSVSDAGFLGVSVRMIVYPFEFPRQTFLRMTGGDLIGSVFSAYKGHFLFSGGSVGIGDKGYSLDLLDTFVRATDTQFAASWFLSGLTAVIRGGSIGVKDGYSVDAKFSRLIIGDGAFDGGIRVRRKSQISVSGGSFGVDASSASLFLNESQGNVTGGNFAGNVRVLQDATIRISGGSIGADPTAIAVNSEYSSSRVEIFGGSFTGFIRAG